MEDVSRRLVKKVITPIRFGKVDEGLAALKNFETTNPMCSAYVKAQIAAFRGEWQTCFEHASFALKYPEGLNSVNVFDDLAELATLAGYYSKNWLGLERLGADAQSLYIPLGRQCEYHRKVLSRIRVFFGKKGAYHHSDIRSKITKRVYEPIEIPNSFGRKSFQEIVDHYLEDRPSTFKKNAQGLLRSLYHSMVEFKCIDEVVTLYECLGYDGFPDTMFFIAKSYIARERYDDAWMFLEKELCGWTSPEIMQVLPTELLIDYSLYSILNEERLNLILSLPKGNKKFSPEIWRRGEELCSTPAMDYFEKLPKFS